MTLPNLKTISNGEFKSLVTLLFLRLINGDNYRLTYWVVFGFFNFIESFIDIILHFLPMYYTFKTLAIVWLMLPQTQVRREKERKTVSRMMLTSLAVLRAPRLSTLVS